jgi:3-hydroxyisobutyrate dehydrogenase-like beta-hydroxyacid dehydrogenase
MAVSVRTSMRRIGIIGVGLLGSAVASRLLAKGLQVSGYDTRRERVTAMEPHGLIAVDSPGDTCAGSDAVFTILPTPDVVEQVWLGPGGLIQSAPASVVLLQMSTISPPLARRLGEAAQARGLKFLDTPIRGTSTMVAQGECAIFVGGDRAVAETVWPAFDAIASKTVHVGPVGAATVTKLAANLLGGLNTIALAEALVLGAQAGVAPAVLLDALRQSPVGSRMMDSRGRQMVEHRFDPFIRLDLFMKDFRLMLEEGGRVGVPLPLTSVAHQLCMATSAAGHGGEDLSSVITTLEYLAGMRPARASG